MDHPDKNHHLASTAGLITRAQAGDQAARAEVLLRYGEPLARFFHGRLPARVRGTLDTADIVQGTMTAALQQLERYEFRGIGSFWAYLRRIGINLIRQEQRKRGVFRVEACDSARLSQATAAGDETPSGVLMRKERLTAFDAALEMVPEQARCALLLRFELGLPYELVARECGYPSADAARMAIGRALDTLASKLSDFRP